MIFIGGSMVGAANTRAGCPAHPTGAAGHQRPPPPPPAPPPLEPPDMPDEPPADEVCRMLPPTCDEKVDRVEVNWPTSIGPCPTYQVPAAVEAGTPILSNAFTQRSTQPNTIAYGR